MMIHVSYHQGYIDAMIEKINIKSLMVKIHVS